MQTNVINIMYLYKKEFVCQKWYFIMLVYIFVDIGCLDKCAAYSPSVAVSILVRNKNHILPYFFFYLYKLDYPKDRMTLRIRCDHSFDNSCKTTEEWVNQVLSEYRNVDFVQDNSSISYEDETSYYNWAPNRMKNVIQLRQDSLDAARISADFYFSLDADILLLNDKILHELMAAKKLVIAPMLNSSVHTFYSNFWGAMSDKGYYMRSDDYLSIMDRHVQGIFEVPMVHSAVLVDLRKVETSNLHYLPDPGYKYDLDDIIIFAKSGLAHKIPFYVINNKFFGFHLVPKDDGFQIRDEINQFQHQRMENIVYNMPLLHFPGLKVELPEKSLYGYDQVYVINLQRRPDRRQKMEAVLGVLGLDAFFVDAVDGKQLNETYLSQLGVTPLSDFLDPFSNRAMTYGEIGCFLSHYFIWKDVRSRGYGKVLILEDDIRFEPGFFDKISHLHRETKEVLHDEWDLIYIGRKLNYDTGDSWVHGSSLLVDVKYSYWTLGYALSLNGAELLVSGNPLSKLVPVDEYLPIMFNEHPKSSYLQFFTNRKLLAYSVSPLLLFPTHYTGEAGYITDTEESKEIKLTGPEVKPIGPPMRVSSKIEL